MSFYFNWLVNEICDFVLVPKPQHKLQYGSKPLFRNAEQATPNCIIYAHLICFHLFPIFTQIKVPFILISGEDDNTVPYWEYNKKSEIGEKILANENLIKWFSVNVDCKHPKLEPIPIGLPKCIPFIQKGAGGDYMAWYLNYHENPVTLGLNSLIREINPRQNISNPDKKLLFVKFTNENSRADRALHKYGDIREKALDVLKEKNLFSGDNNLVPWHQYIKELSEYKFCLSLPGRGLDCFRTWEALTLGVIPIVMRSPTTLYDDLPVVILDTIEQLSQDFLEKGFQHITKNIGKVNWKKLEMSYWVVKILCEREKAVNSQLSIPEQKFLFTTDKLNFSQLWFRGQQGIHRTFLPKLLDIKPNLNILEIGTFEGGTTLFILNNYMHHPDSRIVCIDPHNPAELSSGKDLVANVKEIWQHNINLSKYPEKATLISESSGTALSSDFKYGPFDYILIDGSHLTSNVLEDSVLCFRHLKVGGLLFWDDYTWGNPIKIGPSELPKPAIDAFLLCYKEYVEILHKDYHVVIRKIGEPFR